METKALVLARNVTIYRVQDRNSRGPFRPGLTKHWSEADYRVEGYLELAPQQLEIAQYRVTQGWQYGTGCRSLADIEKWFTPGERESLLFMGFKLVELIADEVYQESEHQVLFGCSRKFNVIAKELAWK